MSWWVLGPEGSGNHIVQDVLSCHPLLLSRKHATRWNSLPRNRIANIRFKILEGTGMWPRLDQFGRGDKILFIHRSGIHSVYSAYRRFKGITPGGVPTFVWYYLTACDFISMFLYGPHKTELVQYEQLMDDPELTKSLIAKFFGVSTDSWDTSKLVLKNRNDDRWKKDSEFYSEVKPYLGIINRRGLGCNGNLY